MLAPSGGRGICVGCLAMLPGFGWSRREMAGCWPARRRRSGWSTSSSATSLIGTTRADGPRLRVRPAALRSVAVGRAGSSSTGSTPTRCCATCRRVARRCCRISGRERLLDPGRPQRRLCAARRSTAGWPRCRRCSRSAGLRDPAAVNPGPAGPGGAPDGPRRAGRAARPSGATGAAVAAAGARAATTPARPGRGRDGGVAGELPYAFATGRSPG